MAINLDSMSRDELLILQADIEKALKTLETRRKAEALKAAQEAARAHGFSLADLTDGAKAPAKKVSAKYANPADPSQTWSGRGRQPVWFREAVAAGADPDSMAL